MCPDIVADVVNLHGLGLTDIIIIAGVAAYLLDRLVDAKGWSPTSKTLRRENEDLIRRNGELERDVQSLRVEVDDLKGKVRDLERTDQASVLRAIEKHESTASERHKRTMTYHEDTNRLLGRAVAALEGGTA